MTCVHSCRLEVLWVLRLKLESLELVDVVEHSCSVIEGTLRGFEWEIGNVMSSE
jgi:hypothetical protein